MKKISTYLPGFAAALAVAGLARMLHSLLPQALVGESVLALGIGLLLNQAGFSGRRFSAGLAFTSRKILKLSIVLLGASLSMGTILELGRLSFSVMAFTLLTCFGGGYIVGKVLGLDWKLSSMISAGTGICGGSAIAALAPVIEAEDKDIAYAISATFLFDMAMVVLFPLMGRAMDLSDVAYGLWAGTSVNDTSSVVAAGYAFSEAAGGFATMVKLTRTLAIIPTVVAFSMVHRSKGTNAGPVSRLFPWFILAFLAMALANSLGFIPAGIGAAMKGGSKFLMVSALSAIGMKTSLADLKLAGAKPMVHGLVISAAVVLAALAAIHAMGLL